MPVAGVFMTNPLETQDSASESWKLILEDEYKTVKSLIKLKKSYDDKIDAGEKLTTQEVQAFLKINEQLNRIKKTQWDRRMAEEKRRQEITPEQAKEVLDKFINILQEHPQVGAAIEKHREELSKIFEEKMKFE